MSNRGDTRRRTGVWIITTKDRVPDTVPLATHVSSLLERVTSDPTVWSALADRHHIRLFVGWFMARENEGTTLDPALLEALGRRSLSLDFDVYATEVAGVTEETP